MARGKYAERARSKRHADQRYAIAVAETNRLRSEVMRIRHLEQENASLRQLNETLRSQIADGSSAREKALTDHLRQAVETMDRMHANYQKDTAEQLRKWDELMDELARYPKTEAWWGAVTAVSRQAIRISEDEKTLPHEALKARIKKTMKGSKSFRSAKDSYRRKHNRRIDRFEARKIRPIESEAVLRELEGSA